MAIPPSQSAWASCGDWLAHPEPIEAAQSETVANGHIAGDLQDDWDMLRGPIAPNGPTAPYGCRGPLCRQSPMGSLPEPVSPVSERYHYETACLARAYEGTAELKWARVENGRVHLGGGISFRIDRPPQA